MADKITPDLRHTGLETLQDAAVANGNGSQLVVFGLARATFDVSIAGTATVNFEAILDPAGTFVAVAAVNAATNAEGTTATATGLYRVDCGGFYALRARISGWSSDAVTVKAQAFAAQSAGAGGGAAVTVSDVQLGAVEIKDGDSDTRLDVEADSGKNAAFVQSNSLAKESGGNLAAAKTALEIIDDWDESDRAKVNPIAGEAGVQGGAGVVTALTQRIAIATNANVVDTELPAAALLADGASVPTAPQVGAVMMAYNSSTMDLWRANMRQTALSSAARTVTTPSSDLTNNNARGAHIIIDVTASGGAFSVTPKIEGRDTASGKYYTILEGVAITATGTTVLKIYPGITPVANAAASDVLPRTVRVTVTHGDATSVTYSVGVSYVL